jgi:hypothetical protein
MQSPLDGQIRDQPESQGDFHLSARRSALLG